VYSRVSGEIDWIRKTVCSLSDYYPSFCKSPTRVACRVLVRYDDVPDEFAWMIKDVTVNRTIMSYGMNSGVQANSIVKVKLGLEVGHSYELFASDQSGNGISNGFLKLRKKVNGKWKRVGKFSGKYGEKVLTFDA
jgi:hypothetical protein